MTCFFIAVLVMLTLSGCKSASDFKDSKQQEIGEQGNTPQEDPKIQGQQTGQAGNDVSGTKRDIDKIPKEIKQMPLDEKIGQMVISGVDAYINDEHSMELIEKYHIGGFILLGKNIKDSKQVIALTNSLKKTNEKSGSKIPLFLGVDQEGGRIDRMPSEFKRLPTNREIGEVNNPEFSFSVGKILGQEVRALGYNLNFAPVLDINSNLKNPVIGNRSFGSTPEVVSILGVETMKGIRSENIIPVVKHFPGHGDTAVDSHTGLPVVNADYERLRSFETIPFAEAVKNDVEMIMVAHILFPEIDSEYPSSLSKKIITDLLIKDLSYKGVIITDDLTMGAIVKNYEIGEAAVRSVNAGSDIVLVCHGYENEIAVIKALKTAVNNGTISEDRVDSSVSRILNLKQKYNLTDKKLQEADINKINALIDSILSKYVN